MFAKSGDWLSAGTVAAALLTAIVGLLMWLDKKSNSRTTEKVGMLAASQASMIAALQESDADKAELRATVKDQASRIRRQDIEIRRQDAEITGLKVEMRELREQIRAIHG